MHFGYKNKKFSTKLIDFLDVKCSIQTGFWPFIIIILELHKQFTNSWICYVFCSLYLVENKPVTEDCLDCLCETMSGCNASTICVNGACGIFRITWGYWVEAGKLTLPTDTALSDDGRFQLSDWNTIQNFQISPTQPSPTAWTNPTVQPTRSRVICLSMVRIAMEMITSIAWTLELSTNWETLSARKTCPISSPRSSTDAWKTRSDWRRGKLSKSRKRLQHNGFFIGFFSPPLRGYLFLFLKQSW